LLDAVNSVNATRIIHTAALLTSAVTQRPLYGTQVNLMGTLNVLEVARLTSVERVVMCGANAVRLGLNGPDGDATLTEDFRLRSVSESPPSFYATGKLAAEWFAANYQQVFGLSTVTMRIGGVFGPWKGAPSGGPSRLMQQIISAAWRDQPIRLGEADLAQSMDFVYAEDVAQGLVLAAQHAAAVSRVYNLSSGQVYSIAEVLALVADRLHRKPHVETVAGQDTSGYRPGELIDISLARTELGYEPEFPLERAIDSYVRWLEQYQA
jgi:UDP-glucose 4-epimerase